jgi:hypothetical protein
MPGVLDFLPLCSQTIVWQPLVSRDQYGKPNYGSPVTFPGRRVYKASRVAALERGTKGQGSEQVSESTIWILGVPAIKYEDLVMVAGDDVATAPPVLSIESTPDENGPLYTKVMLGSANG